MIKKMRLEKGKGTAILVHCMDVICLTYIQLLFNFFRWIKKAEKCTRKGNSDGIHSSITSNLNIYSMAKSN